MYVQLLATLCLLPTLVVSKLTFGTTKFLFTFGDSYTTDGFNISAGVNSPVPGFVCCYCAIHFITRLTENYQTSSNGQNWVQFLGNLSATLKTVSMSYSASQVAHIMSRILRFLTWRLEGPRSTRSSLLHSNPPSCELQQCYTRSEKMTRILFFKINCGPGHSI